MCGIITFISTDKDTHSGKETIKQYQDQYERGQQGFGSIEVHKDGVTINRATEPIKAMLDLRDANAPIVIFHHRHPTSTKNKMRQTHPILVSNKELNFNWLVIHNGVIRNDSKLFEHHTQKLNYIYTTHEQEEYVHNSGYRTKYITDSFNDSESLAIELARYFEGKEDTLDIKGSAAFVALKVNKKTGRPLEIYFGRSETSPLQTRETPAGLLIASEIDEPTGIVPEMSYEVINLEMYFKGKTLPKTITNSELISQMFELQVKKEPIVTKPVISRTIKSLEEPKTHYERKDEYLDDNTSSSNYLNDMFDPFQEYEDERERAFLVMSDRVLDEIKPEVEDYFSILNYDDPGEAMIEDIVEKLRTLLVDRTKKVNASIRKFYENKYNKLLVEYETEYIELGYDTKEDEEELEEEITDQLEAEIEADAKQ